MKYPHVLGELDTLRLVSGGRSLARYGDGEFNLCRGARANSRVSSPYNFCTLLRSLGSKLLHRRGTI